MASSSESESEASLLFENLSLLLEFHNGSKEFKQVFKKDMFATPNKAGMKYTLHFLLPIFQADVFKKTIYWPIYSAKEEATFRSEVLKFIASYNATNKLFELPKTLASTLLTAGGTKLVNFLLHLSTAALELTLRKADKEFGRKHDEFKSFDEEKQKAIIQEFDKEQEARLNEHKQFLAECENYEKEAEKTCIELENERVNALNQLKRKTEESKFLSASEKESFLDLENNSCVENHMEALRVRENSMGVKLEKIAQFKEIVNTLVFITHRALLSKNDEVILDGAKICREELSAITGQLLEDNYLEGPVNLYEDGKLHLADFLRVCEALTQRQLSFVQQILNSTAVPIGEVVKRLETALEQLQEKDKKASELEKRMSEKLLSIIKAIEDIEEELFDSEPNMQESRFKTLLAPSPQVSMPSFEPEDVDENAVYEFAIDSPLVRNFALKLINQLKADKAENGGSQPFSDQSPSSFSGQSNSRAFPRPKSVLNRVNIARRNLGSSPLSRHNNGDLLNQSGLSNCTIQPEPSNMSMNEFQPGGRQTSTPISSESPNVMESAPSSSCLNELPKDSPSASSASKANENSEQDVYSPRGIFKLNSSNAEDDEELNRLSEHFAPKTPAHRRASFLNLIERFQKIKAGSTVYENPINED